MAQFSAKGQSWMGGGTRNDIHEVSMVADQYGNIINDFGGIAFGQAPSSSDIIARINIAAGNITGYSYINKFGYRDIPSSLTNYYPLFAAYGKDDTGEYYDWPTSPSVATVSSSIGSDNGGTVTVSGLDADYNEVSETITIGQSGTSQFLRVHRASLITAGTGDTNAGNITVVVDGNDVAYIPAGYGQTLQTLYTVPAGKTAYIFQIDLGVDEKEKPVHARVRVRDNTVANAAWQTKAFIVMESNYISHNQTVPIHVPEKTDIMLEANSSAGDIEISGGFDLVLVEN